MRILLSNDDGVTATGIAALRKELEKKHEVWVVAPLEDNSTCGHFLTLHKPLRLQQFDKRVFGVSGGPADSVLMAVNQILPKRPDLVVSGINRGANLGQDTFYSGTVAAAREAAMIGIPAIAVSLVINFSKMPPENKLNYPAAAKWVTRLLKEFPPKEFGDQTYLNLNVPDRKFQSIKGVQVTQQGTRHYSGNVYRRKDHRGNDYYWVGGKYKGFHRRSGTDVVAVADGYVSLTPQHLDTTNAQYHRLLTRRLSDGQ